MFRRTFLAAVALVALPLSLSAETLDYTPGLVKERLAAGETVFVGFQADWCTTCRSQERTIDALKSTNAAYDENVTFVRVDWDRYRRADLANELNIPRRSTLVVLRGAEELGRNVANTSRGAIKELMNVALNAAAS
jgi:thiol-disulfide isomerase/thioredoxin